MDEYLEYLQNLEIELNAKTEDETQKLEKLESNYKRWRGIGTVAAILLPLFFITGIFSIPNVTSLSVVIAVAIPLLWFIAEFSSDKMCSSIESMLDVEDECLKERKLQFRNRIVTSGDELLDKLTYWSIMYELDREQRFEYRDAVMFINGLVEDYLRIRKKDLWEE